MRILIRKGYLIDPGNGTEGERDILIEDGVITKIEPSLKEHKADTTIEAKGKWVIPGLIDLHTHLREPGREDEETIYTGARAGVKGGYAALCCMPNTEPPIDDPSVVELIQQKARSAPLKVYAIGCISRKRAGKALSEMGLLKEAGVVGFSDDGEPVMDSLLLRRAMEYSLLLDLPLILHCEDKRLSLNGVMHEGYYSTLLGLPGIPSEAEAGMVKRDLELARLTGAKIHIAHVSCQRSVEYIREAKESGVKVTAEVTPHHLLLTDKAVLNFDTNTKVNPPLRSEEDRQALLKGLKEGVIDAISTDHAPHLSTEKEYDFLEAPFGMIGLEISFSALFTQLVETGNISALEMVKAMSFTPAKIFHLPGGELSPGKLASLSIFNPKVEWLVSKDELESLSYNTPFLGNRLKGKFEWVIVEGKIVQEKGRIK
ncbi:MAG: dihydroorotase [Caldiserica bacterium]|nr:dihydroorotase [Caldisericota bacterium]